MTLITDTKELADFCARIAKSGFVTVDTEFMRERSYWPKLCVVQLGGAEEAAAVDALAPGIDLTPVFDLMADTAVLKVFHAGRQDLEIFYHLTNRLPDPVFDTQIAAMVCGFGDAAGYETLVSKLTRAHLDKAARFTDWSVRPLTERQVTYALADVTHLRKVYEKLQKKLSQNGRTEWLAEEITTLTSTETYAPDPKEAYRRIKTRSAKPRYLAILREIAAWRELEAQRLDLPRNHVMRDESLVEIAHHIPTTPAELGRTRAVGRRLAEGPAGAALLEALVRGKAVPDSECPPPIDRPLLPNGIGPVTDLLKVLLKMKSEESGTASRLVASSDDLELIAAFGEKADVPALHGWRRQVFGDDALKLSRGEIALVVDGRQLAVIPVADD